MGKIKRRRARRAEGSDDEGTNHKDTDHKVGYGSPPRQSQFKAGQSGNPKGRPKGARNFKTDVNTTLREPVKVARKGKMRRVSTQAALLLRLREKALNGDARSLERLLALAQTYGDEPPVSMELPAEDERVLQVYHRRVLSGLIPEFKSTESKNGVDRASGSNATAETLEIALVEGEPIEDGSTQDRSPGK